MNECLIPYPESEQARRMLWKVCVGQHGEALLDALCQDKGKSIEERVEDWLVKKVLPALEGKTRKQRAPLETEAETDEAESFAPQPLYGKADRLPVSELRANLVSLFISEFGATKNKVKNTPQWLAQRLLSRKLEEALVDLCRHWQRPEGEAEAFKVLGNVINQYFYAANADNSDQPRNMANIERAVKELERRALREQDDHERLRLSRQYGDAGRLTEALWAYFAEHGGLKDVKTKEQLLAYVLQLPRFHQTDENLDILAQHIPELDEVDHPTLFLCFSRLPRDEREAIEAKLGVVVAPDGIRPSPVKFLDKKAMCAHYGVSAETLRQRFNSAARQLAHCLWNRVEEANDEHA